MTSLTGTQQENKQENNRFFVFIAIPIRISNSILQGGYWKSQYVGAFDFSGCHYCCVKVFNVLDPSLSRFFNAVIYWIDVPLNGCWSSRVVVAICFWTGLSLIRWMNLWFLCSDLNRVDILCWKDTKVMDYTTSWYEKQLTWGHAWWAGRRGSHCIVQYIGRTRTFLMLVIFK